MKKITILFTFLFSISLLAQNINLNDPLPENTKVIKGVLPNGFTYYIYKTDVVKDAASYYIIQNVGSVLEDENQQGLAHFLEHMAFNGTDNFPDKGITDKLEKHGASFGKDINAYTSFEETVYNMNNIPATPELIDNCLLVLHDWANFLSLKDEEIDLERGVIKEEWRTRQTGYMRIYEKHMPALFNNSIYTKRMPIGKMDVVDNFKYKVLRDFYHDWYRTDLQAIAIIGDVNVEEVQAKIEKLFSKIPAVESPRERFVVSIPENDALIFSSAMDVEVKSTSIEFGIRHPKNLEKETVGDLKSSLLRGIATMILGIRLGELNDDPGSPLLRASVNYGSISRSTNVFKFGISPKVSKQQAAFEMVLKEVNRAVKFGFTQGELDRAITMYKNSYENQISKMESISHRNIEGMIQKNYLENSRMRDVEKDYSVAEQIFNTLTLEELHLKLKSLYTIKNRYITATGVKGEENLTEAEALQIISAAENDTALTAYKDEFSGKTLLGNVKIKKGKIVSEKENKETASSTFILSNGIKIHYKFADKTKNDVNLNALSYGGRSLIDDADLPSASYMNGLVSGSGLGDYPRNDLSKVLAGKTARTNLSISNLTESVSGSSSTKDVETMLQMVHLRFVKPRFEKEVFDVLIANSNNQLVRKSESLSQKIKDSTLVTFYGKNNPKKPLFTKEYIESVSFETIQQIYKERFNNASDFEFFIVGDVSKEQLKPLLENYIASIPTKKQTETYKDNSTEWLSKIIKKDLFFKMENPKTTVSIIYKNDVEYSLKNALVMKAFGDILQLRYMETLREQEGGTYGTSTSAGLSKRPREKGTLSVRFDCNPEKADKLIAMVYDELNKVAAGKVEENDFNKTISNFLKEREQAKDYNQYEMNVLTNFYREGYDMNDPANFENIVNSIAMSDIVDMANKIIKDADKAEVIIKALD
ncbi:insulinase family protein [Algibacter sp. TI.3.09]|uniref:M16 family metallopeptidase n=1 Tax=Algibacter sp. TI.3.09 TaxID=3121298 RepID=UPI00311E85AB